MAIDPLTALGLSLDFIEKIHNLVKSKVVVNPKSFSSFSNNWNTTRQVVVSNLTDSPLFGVQIVLWFVGVDPKVEVTIEAQEGGHVENIGNVEINTDSLIINGTANEKEVMLIQLSYLPAKVSKRIFIKPTGVFNTSLEVVKFSKDPGTFATKENGVALPFSLPFPMSLKSTSILMKRKS